MNKKDNNTGLSKARFMAYLKGRLSGSEQNKTERLLQKDLFEKEAMEGLESIDPKLIEKDLLYLKKQIHPGSPLERQLPLLKIAASLAVVLILSFSFFKISRKYTDTMPIENEISEVISIQDSLTNRTAKVNVVRPEEHVDFQSNEAIETDSSHSEIPSLFKKKKPNDENTSTIAIKKDNIQAEALTTLQKERDTKQSINTNQISAKSIAMSTPVSRLNSKSSKKGSIKSVIQPKKESVKNLISGVVVFGNDEQPVSGVRFYNTKDSTFFLSDQTGKFFIETDKNEIELFINFIGIEPLVKTLKKGESHVLNIPLPEMNKKEIILFNFNIELPIDHPKEIPFHSFCKNFIADSLTAATPSLGQKRYNNYLRRNLRKFEKEKEKVIVILDFSVSLKGKPESFNLVYSNSKKLPEEVIHLFEAGPLWKPASFSGRYYKSKNRIMIIHNK